MSKRNLCNLRNLWMVFLSFIRPLKPGENEIKTFEAKPVGRGNMFQRLLIVLALVLIVGVTAARAQSDDAPEPKEADRSYKLLREDT